MSDAPRWEVTSFDELERLPALDGELEWRPLRRRLGIQAFGTNAYTADAGRLVIEEHTEGTNRHEELYVVVTGRATFTIDGEELDGPAGTLVHVQPDSKRVATAAEDGTTVLVLAGIVGAPFTVSSWEAIFAGYGYRALGDPERGRRLVEEQAAAQPDAWQGHYHLACFDALDGRRDEALANLRRAVELDPKAAEYASDDADFASIRDDPWFRSAVAGES